MTDSVVEAISDWATTAGILIGLVAWWYAREDASRKDRALSLYQEEAKREIAAANERAAVLEKETAEARLKYEQLKKELSWRELSEKQFTAMRQELSKHPITVEVEHVAGDPEAQLYALYIARVFQQAGWIVSIGSHTFANTLPLGLFIHGQPGPHLKLVQDALNASAVPFSTEPFDRSGVSLGGGFSDPKIRPAVVIIVGSKAPRL